MQTSIKQLLAPKTAYGRQGETYNLKYISLAAAVSLYVLAAVGNFQLVISSNAAIHPHALLAGLLLLLLLILLLMMLTAGSKDRQVNVSVGLIVIF